MDGGLNIVSNGTDTHVFLVDLTEKGLTGKETEEALEQAGITVNKNTVPLKHAAPLLLPGFVLGLRLLQPVG